MRLTSALGEGQHDRHSRDFVERSWRDDRYRLPPSPFMAGRRIERDEPNVTALHYRRSSPTGLASVRARSSSIRVSIWLHSPITVRECRWGELSAGRSGDCSERRLPLRLRHRASTGQEMPKARRQCCVGLKYGSNQQRRSRFTIRTFESHCVRYTSQGQEPAGKRLSCRQGCVCSAKRSQAAVATLASRRQPG